MIKEFFKRLLKKGFTISYSDGKPFNPRNQKRKSAMDDLLHPKKEDKNEHMEMD